MGSEIYVFHPVITLQSSGWQLAWNGDMYLVGENQTGLTTDFLSGLPEIILQGPIKTRHARVRYQLQN